MAQCWAGWAGAEVSGTRYVKVKERAGDRGGEGLGWQGKGREQRDGRVRGGDGRKRKRRRRRN